MFVAQHEAPIHVGHGTIARQPQVPNKCLIDDPPCLTGLVVIEMGDCPDKLSLGQRRTQTGFQFPNCVAAGH